MIDEAARETALKAGIDKLHSCIVVPEDGKLTKQEMAVLFNFRACLDAAIQAYVDSTTATPEAKKFSDYIEGRIKYLNDYGFDLTPREKEEAELAWEEASAESARTPADVVERVSYAMRDYLRQTVDSESYGDGNFAGGDTWVSVGEQEIDISELARVAIAAMQPVPCKKCGQVPAEQSGEYPCSECGLPTMHDEPQPVQVDIGWQPIETAPKDGARIWLRKGNAIETGKFIETTTEKERYHAGYGCYDMVEIEYESGFAGDNIFSLAHHHERLGDEAGNQPTHWLPLAATWNLTPMPDASYDPRLIKSVPLSGNQGEE